MRRWHLRWNFEKWVEFGSVEMEGKCILGPMEQQKRRHGRATLKGFYRVRSLMHMDCVVYCIYTQFSCCALVHGRQPFFIL